MRESSIVIGEEAPAPEDAIERVQEDASAPVDPQNDAQEIEFERLCLEIRGRANVIERAELVANAKTLFETLYPKAKQGGAPGKAGGGKAKTPSSGGFVAVLVERTLRSASSVHGDVEIATRVAADVRDRLRDTPVASQTTTLLGLARLPSKSRYRIQRKLAEEYLRVRAEADERAAERGLKAALAEHRPPVERKPTLPPLLSRSRPARVVEGAPKDFAYLGRAIRVVLVSVAKGEAKVTVEVADAASDAES
jgi:hypothetical protein